MHHPRPSPLNHAVAALAFGAAALAPNMVHATCPPLVPESIFNTAEYAVTPMNVVTCAMVPAPALVSPEALQKRLGDAGLLEGSSEHAIRGAPLPVDHAKLAQKAEIHARYKLPYTHIEQLIADAGWVLRVRAMPPSSYQTHPDHPSQKNFPVAFLQVLEALKGNPAAIPRFGGKTPISAAQSMQVTYPINVIAKKDQLHGPDAHSAIYDPREMPLRVHSDARARLHLRPQDVPGVIAPVWCDSTQSLFEGAEYLMILDAKGFAQNFPHAGNAPLPFTCGAPRLERIQSAQKPDAANSPDPWYAWVKKQIEMQAKAPSTPSKAQP